MALQARITRMGPVMVRSRMCLHAAFLTALLGCSRPDSKQTPELVREYESLGGECGTFLFPENGPYELTDSGNLAFVPGELPTPDKGVIGFRFVKEMDNAKLAALPLTARRLGLEFEYSNDL